MMKLIVAITSSLILACSSLVTANDIVEVRILETPTAVQPTTRPATAAPKLPKDVKVLLSMETLADQAGDLHAKCTIGPDTTIDLEGHLKTTADGKRHLRLKFSQRDQSSTQEVSTNTELAVNDPTVIGGSFGGKGSHQFVATIKPEAATVNGKGQPMDRSAAPVTGGRATGGDKLSLDLSHNVRFTGVQDVFSRNALGDAIVITAIHGTARTIAIGNTYRIDGAYTLASRDVATLSAYLTDREPNLPHRQTIPGQSVRIRKGSGTFTLYLKVEDPGCPHVSFYPEHGGESFAGEYFGSGDSLPPESWLAKPQVAAR